MSDKKSAGFAVIRATNGDLAGYHVKTLSDAEAADLIQYIGQEQFVQAVQEDQMYTVGEVKSETGMAFNDLPVGYGLGIMIADGPNRCGYLTHLSNNQLHIESVIRHLGGRHAFNHHAHHFGNTYIATPAGASTGDDSVQWCPSCT